MLYDVIRMLCAECQSVDTNRASSVAERLANHLDLIDLDSLSLTCHVIRESIIQFASQLKHHSLRCAFDVEVKDEQPDQHDTLLALQLSMDDQIILSASGGPAFPVAFETPTRSLRLHSKMSRCARDLVAPCRKCGISICRNCIEKPPSNNRLPGRLRRLCDSCIEAPLIMHKAPMVEINEPDLLSSSTSSTRSNRSDSSASDTSEHNQTVSLDSVLEMPEIWLRDPCTCASKGVYLCHDCGHSAYAADNIYQRVWRWRSRYSTHLGGGLGTGLGLGNQGQKCGRDKYCLATKDAMALVEAEWSSEDVSTPGAYESSRSNTPVISEDGRHGPGYFRQEIEGIGGEIKSKSRKLVKVGATVYEFRDERESGNHLGREFSGELRSWCSWCARVCPSHTELAPLSL